MSCAPISTSLKLAAKRLETALGVAVCATQLSYDLGFWILRANLLDSLNANDGADVLGELLVEFFKTKTDDAVLVEALALDFHKALRDEAKVVDVQSIGVLKGLTEQAPVSDATANTLHKPFTDKATSREQLSNEVTKSVLDPVAVTDDIDGAASILDDQNMQYFKELTTVYSASDVFYRLIAYTRQLNESASITDSGLVRSQSYSDYAYFEEDYVGSSRTF